jgi:hypothetical protein
MTTISTRPPGVTIHVESTSIRSTVAPPAARFRAALSTSAGALLSGVESASTMVPGGSAVAAAVRGAASALTGPGGSGTGESPEGPGGGAGEGGAPGTMEDAMRTQADDNMRFLQLQAQIQAENQRFTTLSNVMKARHETAKTAIGNIR